MQVWFATCQQFLDWTIIFLVSMKKKSVKILLFSDHMEMYFCYHYKLGQYSKIQLELEDHMIIANWGHWWMSCSDS